MGRKFHKERAQWGRTVPLVALGLGLVVLVALVAAVLSQNDGSVQATGPTPEPSVQRTATPVATLAKPTPSTTQKIPGGEARVFEATFGGNQTCVFQIRLKGVFSNGANFDWIYEVIDVNGQGCGLSHMVFSLCQPNATDAFVSGSSTATNIIGLVVKDPTTGLSGVKFNDMSEVEDFVSGNFTYTLSNNFPVTDILMVFKVGNGNIYGTIEGPDCAAKKETSTPTPTPVTPTPTPITPSPTPVTPSPTPITPTPTPVTPSPTPITPSPTPITPSPTPVTPSPTPITPSPTPVMPSPTPITPSPTPVTPSPTPILLKNANLKLDPPKAIALGPGDTQSSVNDIKVTASAIFQQDMDGDGFAGWSKISATISWSAQSASANLTSKGSLSVSSGTNSDCTQTGTAAKSVDGGCLAVVDKGAPSAFNEETAAVNYSLILSCGSLGTVGTHVVTVTVTILREDGSAVPPAKAIVSEDSEQIECNAPPPTPTPTPTNTSTPTNTPTVTPTPDGTPSDKVFHLKTPSLSNLFLTNQQGQAKAGLSTEAGTTIAPQTCRAGTDVALFTNNLSLEPTSISPKGDPQRVAAFEMEVQYDPQWVCVNVVPGDYWFLQANKTNPFTGNVRAAAQAIADSAAPVAGGGSPISLSDGSSNVVCFIDDKNDGQQPTGLARIGCVFTGKALKDIDQTLPMAYVLVKPQPEVYNQIIPNQENGIVTLIRNKGCSLADEQGHAIDSAGCDDATLTIRWLEADFNGDCKVDVLDQQALSSRWGAKAGSLLFNARMDTMPFGNIQGDQVIDIKDVQFAFGRNGSVCSEQNRFHLKGTPHPDQDPVPIK